MRIRATSVFIAAFVLWAPCGRNQATTRFDPWSLSNRDVTQPPRDARLGRPLSKLASVPKDHIKMVAREVCAYQRR
jgi:hypothetical protein